MLDEMLDAFLDAFDHSLININKLYIFFNDILDEFDNGFNSSGAARGKLTSGV